MKRRRRSKKNIADDSIPVAVKVSKKKLWLFRFLGIVLVPILFLCILEGGLRLFGYGYRTSAIVKCDLEDKQVDCHNYKFGWRFFPHSAARYFDGFVFDTEKSPKTCRIFVLGASAALGVPAPAYNFGHILEVMLDEMYPDVDFEVHTAAMAAINSHAVMEIAEDCARYEPDFFIVYLGNNEVVGPFGPGTVFAPFSPSLSMIRANITIKSTRTGQLLEQVFQWITPQGNIPQQWTGMEMFLGNQVRYDDPRLETVYHHFEQNLRDICRTGQKAGAAVIVSTVGSNLRDCPPFASLHRKDLTDAKKHTWQTIYEEGIAHETYGQFQEAVGQYLKAAQIDDTYADLQFRLGKCYWNTGYYQKAKESYINARTYDTLRFRADNRINEIIRTVTKSEGAYLADSVAAIEEKSPHQIPGSDFFYEHVHMKFEGNYTVAMTMLPHIQNALQVAPRPAGADVLTIENISRCLAYTDYERMVNLTIVYESFLQDPPFTNQLFHEEMLRTTEEQIYKQRISLEKTDFNALISQHRDALQKRPEDWQMLFQYSAFLNSAMKDLKAEETELRKVLKLCPYHSAYLNLGINLHQQGRFKESQNVLFDLLELNPNVVRGYIELASIYRERRDYKEYIQNTLKAMYLEPENSPILYINLADAYDKTGQRDKAIETLNRALTIFPESQTATVHASLAYFLNMEGDSENALKEMRQALKIDPGIGNDASFKSHLKFLENKVNH